MSPTSVDPIGTTATSREEPAFSSHTGMPPGLCLEDGILHVRWREIHDLESREMQDCLAKARREHIVLVCDCLTSTPPQLFTTRLTTGRLVIVCGPHGASRHAIDCPRRAMEGTDSAASVATRVSYPTHSVQRREDGKVDVALAFSLRVAEAAAECVQTGSSSDERDHVRALRPLSGCTLLGLLMVIWEEARFHESTTNVQVGSPEFWAGLRKASRCIHPLGARLSGWGMDDILLLPRSVDEGQASRNAKKLADAVAKRRKLLACALLKQSDLDQRPWSWCQSVFDSKDLNARGAADEERTTVTWHDRLSKKFSRELALARQGAELVVCILLSAGASATGIEDVAVLTTTPHSIPVASKQELSLALVLRDRGRRFVKPLRRTTEQIWPDFLLKDVGAAPAALEVYGMADRDEYQERMREKREIYAHLEASGDISKYWEWDAISHSELARWLEHSPLPLPAGDEKEP